MIIQMERVGNANEFENCTFLVVVAFRVYVCVFASCTAIRHKRAKRNKQTNNCVCVCVCVCVCCNLEER